MGPHRFHFLSRDWARLALVAAPVLMGLAILVSGWSTYRGVQAASDTLVKGQSDALVQRVLAQLMQLPRPVPQEDLREIGEELRDEGLLALALVTPEGVVGPVGEPLWGPNDLAPLLRRASGIPTMLDGYAVVVFHAPAGRPGRRLFRGRPPMPALVLAFEPRMALQLEAAALRTLGVGALAALVFVALAVAGARWSQKRQRWALEREHAQRLEALGQMSAVLAHEIRNPLASLKGNAQLLLRALPEGAKEHDKAKRVVSEAVRLETLTNDLLDFVRRGKLQPGPADPSLLLKQAAASLQMELPIDNTHAPPQWTVDAQRLLPVLTNLLANAREAGGDTVQARVAKEQDQLLIEISDLGAGIPPADLPHIFEPFFTRRTQGTGLGLAVAKRMVDLHGGRIEAHNANLGGAVFRVWLPGTLPKERT